MSAAATIWNAISAEPLADDAIHFEGAPGPLKSVFDVNGLAAAAVGVASLAAAEFLAERRGGRALEIAVDRRNASALFVSEKLQRGDGWDIPLPWDPIAGDYETSDGWIRLHTNYERHRRAVLNVLGVEADRERVASKVREWGKVELESAVVAAGGAAAAMRSRDEWQSSEAGAATATEPVAHVVRRDSAWTGDDVPSGQPFAGIRVLDLTRVIAGPVATSFLGALGADVLRIDPPGFEEVPALLPLTTAGKRRAFLDLNHRPDRDVIATLIEEADVVVSGLRPDALGNIGLGVEELQVINPSIITARLDAYGWSGPWRLRRGFDSLVQMSCGIADAGMAAGSSGRPTPLPAQALDHATGFVLAAAVGHALTERSRDGVANDIRCSLIGTANLLQALEPAAHEPAPEWDETDTVEVSTHWGEAQVVPLRILGNELTARHAGPLGQHEPRWIDRI